MAGTIKADVIQLGDSGTADNNFFLKTNGDGSASLVRGNNPTGTNILTVSAAGKVNIESSILQSATAVASTSGTSIDFTGIPSWARRITVMFNGVSTSGTSNYLVQLGSASGVETTSYISFSCRFGATSLAAGANSTIGFVINNPNAAAETLSGQMIISNLSQNIWTEQACAAGNNVNGMISGGVKTLSDTLDRIRITTVNGTDTFDAGSINIMWE
jgi:hypothetical protein